MPTRQRPARARDRPDQPAGPARRRWWQVWRWPSLRQPWRWAALVAGGVPVLAFPDPNLELLAWVGLVPGLLLMALAPTPREAAVRAWWLGSGYLTGAMYWLAPNLGPALLLFAAALGALCAGVGLAVRATLAPPVTAGRAALALVLVPSTWLTTEWLRSWQGFGGPWAVLGVSQWQHPVILALAALGGVWLVSFALVLANTGVVIALLARRLPLRLAGLAVAVVAAGAGPVAFALTSPAPVTAAITVALVQPGLTISPTQRVRREERMTEYQATGTDLVVWGESSVGYDLARDPVLRRRLEALTVRAGSQILVNQDAADPAGALEKQATLLGPRGVAGRYVKSRLVPFGEYIPFRSELGWITAISRAAPSNVRAGPGARIMHVTLPAGRGLSTGRELTIGPLICFESAFPDMARHDADHGARLIVYQTSDSTFQGSWALDQHASLGAVRAAETGRPTVQAALTGDSAAFDPRGRLLARAAPGQQRVLRVRVPLPAAASRTPFDRLGDYVPDTALAVVALTLLAGLARRLVRGTYPG